MATVSQPLPNIPLQFVDSWLPRLPGPGHFEKEGHPRTGIYTCQNTCIVSILPANF
jgi:hypothetical protein